MTRTIACALVVGLWTGLVPAQQPDTFRSRADLVLVDVTVTGADGRPARGLKADDFQVREDGTFSSIATFREVVVEDTDAPVPSIGREAGAAIGSNLPRLDGRLILIVFDDLGRDFSAGRMNRANQIALKLVERLGPTDQAAVVATSGNTAYHRQFTSDKASLARLFRGHVLGESNTGLATLDMLRVAAAQLAAIPGRRKILAFISEGNVGVNARDVMDPESRVPEMRDFVSVAQRANIAVYTFNPRYAGDLDSMVLHETVGEARGQAAAERSGDDALRAFADNTGGRAMSRSNLFADAADRMFADSGSYYLIGYYSPKPPDGKFRRVQVTTRRDDLSVRTRTGYVSAKPRELAKPAAPLDGLLRAPIQMSGLDLRVVAVPAPSEEPGKGAILVVTEIRASDISGDGVELALLASTADGTIRGSERTTLKVTGHVDEGRWVPVASRLTVSKGAHQVRIAARRLDGSAEGSTFVDVEVPDFGEALALGGLALGPRSHANLANGERLSSFLPITPVATSEVRASTTLVAVLPVRVSRARAGALVAYLATLTGPDESVRELQRESESAEAFTGARGRTIEVDLPDGLPSGEHRLRIEVSGTGLDTRAREVVFRIVP